MFEGLMRSQVEAGRDDGGSSRLLEKRLTAEGLDRGGVPFRLVLFFLRGAGPLARLLARKRVPPDLISISSVLFAGGTGFFLGRGETPPAALLFLGSGLCDMLDGWVARLRGVASRQGEVLDALCDRFSEALVYGAFLVLFLRSAPGVISGFGAFSSLLGWFGSFLMSYASALTEAAPPDARRLVSRGVMRRGERAVLLLAAILLWRVEPRISALVLFFQGGVAGVSAIQRMHQLRAAYRSREALEPKSLPLRAPFDLLETERRMLAPGIQRLAMDSGIVLKSGVSSLLRDESGAEYIDWVAGMGVASLGHSDPRWSEALSRQAGLAAVGSFTTRVRVNYLERIRDRAPAGLDLLQLYSGGAEAVESAIRLVQEARGRRRIAHFSGSFHGKTRGALSVMGSAWKKTWGPYEDLGPLELPFPDCTRCPLGLAPRNCQQACFEQVESMLAEACDEVAAVIFEPIQGTAGNLIPPAGFWGRLARSCRTHGILMIADEMITGFGRTGRFWAIDHSDIQPDIVLAGKGMAGGYPVSAVFLSAGLARGASRWSAVSGSSSSYGGNPLACAAALATLDIIEADGLVRNSEVQGALFLDLLRDLQGRWRDVISDVRGIGLLIGIDLTDDIDESLRQSLFREALGQGLLTLAFSPRIRINPPLCITETEVRESVRRFERALERALREGVRASERRVNLSSVSGLQTVS